MRLYSSSLKQKLRQKEELFWGLLFPIALATLFFVSFGSGVDLEQMSAVPAALVSEGNVIFETYLDEMDGGMIALTRMEEDEAAAQLRNGAIRGVFYSGREPSLTVAASSLETSILETVLSSFLENQAMLLDIAEGTGGLAGTGKNPFAGLADAAAELADYKELTESVTAGGESMDTNIGYFYALIGMACLFGAFMGMNASTGLRADQSPLAVRRSITPVHRLWMVLSEMFASFTVQFLCVCALLLYLHFLGIPLGEKWWMLLPVCALGSMIGVAFGIFIGSLRLGEGVKVTILVGSSLSMSMLAGLMFVNMKDIVERHAPLVNRINPAALISDAFYSISIYENPARYRNNLLILALITVLLAGFSFLRLRRERYESL